MTIVDDALEKLGLKYEELSPVEKDTLFNWDDLLKKNAVTLDTVKEYLERMRDSVEEELVDEPEFNRIFLFRIQNRKQILLKARLKNYLLLLALLGTPEKAKKAIEKQLAGLVSTK